MQITYYVTYYANIDKTTDKQCLSTACYAVKRHDKPNTNRDKYTDCIPHFNQFTNLYGYDKRKIVLYFYPDDYK